MIEATGEKHKEFAEQLEQRDAEIFLNIPALLILKSLENDDKEICSFFYPDMYEAKTETGMQVAELKRVYGDLRKKLGSYELYNLMEKCLIEIKLDAQEDKTSREMDIERVLLRDIRGLAMQLSRCRPADWNKFLDVVIK